MWNGCLITCQVMLHLTEYLHSINYLPLTSNFKVFCRLGSWEDIVVPGSETPNKGSSLVKLCVETGIKAWWQDSQAKFSSDLGSGVGILPTLPSGHADLCGPLSTHLAPFPDAPFHPPCSSMGGKGFKMYRILGWLELGSRICQLFHICNSLEREKIAPIL